MIDVTRTVPMRWTARRDGDDADSLRALVRPDGVCFLYTTVEADDVHHALITAAVDDLPGDLYTEVDDQAAERLADLAGLGFSLHRAEHRYVLPVDPARTGLGDAALPAGFTVVSAADADVQRLAALDDTLRADVPGAAGWHNDPAEFARQTFDDPQFDRDTYLVAVDASGGYAGLVRVWRRPVRSRLGLIAVVRDHRRSGLARALLGRAFAVLHAQGEDGATCEVDVTNVASNALMIALGGQRDGGNVELVLRRHSA
ncbi:MAG TPA: GNAT family N-acetyltransferase [Pseudonocardiaceae bacterium]|nr:GNAT family N-acetyltransferase [Pseudonocardiaceae bacterium]